MIIEDHDSAEEFLRQVHYYRFSAYLIDFKDVLKENTYLPDTTFNKVVTLYDFDRRLRSLLFEVLETIEVTLRAQISHELAIRSGALSYKDTNNFFNEKFHSDSLIELNNQIRKRRSSEAFIDHHFKKYDGNLPIWAAIEVTSFGFLSRFYKNLKIKKYIAKNYYNVPPHYLESWFQCLSNIRNICAHYGRLFNKPLTFRPKLFKEDGAIINNNSLFAVIIIIIRLLSDIESNRFLGNFEVLINEFKDELDLNVMGMPEDWKTILTNSLRK